MIDPLTSHAALLSATRPQEAELREAAGAFEGLLLGAVLRHANRGLGGSGLLDGGPGGRMYRELFLDEVARLAAGRGALGLGRLVEEGARAKPHGEGEAG